MAKQDTPLGYTCDSQSSSTINSQSSSSSRLSHSTKGSRGGSSDKHTDQYWLKLLGRYVEVIGVSDSDNDEDTTAT